MSRARRLAAAAQGIEGDAMTAATGARLPLIALALAIALAPALAPAQAPPPPPSSPPAEASPPAPTPAPAPAPAAPATPVQGARPTLIPEPGDPVNVDEVLLPEKPVLILSGTSTWDEGLKTLRAAFATIEAELGKLGIAPAGRPLAAFTQTTDDTFRFDAMIPIGAAPTSPPTLPAEMRFGTTPSGKAFRFVHKGPYDDVDTTYETITTYLEVKDLVAKDVFIEEYVNDVADPTDPGLEVNIYVQPR